MMPTTPLSPPVPVCAQTPLLLVSVRSVGETAEALAGGADIVDIKEPDRGPLGRAEWSTIGAIAQSANGPASVPLTAALGELADEPRPPDSAWPTRLRLLKVGLAGLGSARDWRCRFEAVEQRFATFAPVIAAAYADWQLAGSPPVAEVVGLAIERRLPFVLIDTYAKGTGDLFRWLDPRELGELCSRCREGGVRVAAAGALGPHSLERLIAPFPDVLAFRGAACHASDRHGRIDRLRVAELKESLRRLSQLSVPDTIAATGCTPAQRTGRVPNRR